ncbi:MAG TPA: S8 family serine peptidase [Gemmataceae bacterium]|nr:S8 family serine peptidase [Gemmataceae bacterium]
MRHVTLTCALLLLGLAGVRAADPLDDNPPRPAGVARPANIDDARRKLGLLPDYANVPGVRNVKVAVLDSGFDGFDGKRPYLPANTVLVEHYDPAFVARNNLGDPNFQKPLAPGNPHGRLMAQLVWATAGSLPDGPQFFLLNANGPTMLRRAVRYAVEQKVDVILFSGTFEGAGNYDGRGPINAAVGEATAAGVIWVNAAGNTGGAVFNGPVVVGPDRFLRLRGGNDPTALRFTNRFDENAVTITLTWNDYRDEEDFGTDKDLDLVVEDAAGRVVGSSTLRQVPPGKPAGDGETKNPRERLVLTDLPAVQPGQEYRIRVKANSANFGPHDRIRILLTAARDVPFPDPDTGRPVRPVELLDATGSGEVYPPADHPAVLTVGDTSRGSAVGPTADGRVKPDVVLGVSTARFSNGEESAGSSNAAAYFAGVAVVLKGAEPGLTVSHLRAWVRFLDVKAPPAVPVAAPAPAAFPPVRPVLPPSPNELRAMRYADSLATDNRRQRGLPPLVVISGGRGEYQVNPGAPAPAAPAPAAPLPASPPSAPAADPRLPHVPWQTPPPRALAELVRGRP